MNRLLFAFIFLFLCCNSKDSDEAQRLAEEEFEAIYQDLMKEIEEEEKSEASLKCPIDILEWSVGEASDWFRAILVVKNNSSREIPRFDIVITSKNAYGETIQTSRGYTRSPLKPNATKKYIWDFKSSYSIEYETKRRSARIVKLVYDDGLTWRDKYYHEVYGETVRSR